jgi:hypothetical protein
MDFDIHTVTHRDVHVDADIDVYYQEYDHTDYDHIDVYYQEYDHTDHHEHHHR